MIVIRWIARLAGWLAFAAIAAVGAAVAYVIIAQPSDALTSTIQSWVVSGGLAGAAALGVWAFMRVIQGALGGGKRASGTKKGGISSRQAVRYARMGMQRD